MITKLSLITDRIHSTSRVLQIYLIDMGLNKKYSEFHVFGCVFLVHSNHTKKHMEHPLVWVKTYPAEASTNFTLVGDECYSLHSQIKDVLTFF